MGWWRSREDRSRSHRAMHGNGAVEVVTSYEETPPLDGATARRRQSGPPVHRVPGSPVPHCSFSTFCLGNGSWAISWIPMCVVIKKPSR